MSYEKGVWKKHTLGGIEEKKVKDLKKYEKEVKEKLKKIKDNNEKKINVQYNFATEEVKDIISSLKKTGVSLKEMEDIIKELKNLDI